MAGLTVFTLSLATLAAASPLSTPYDVPAERRRASIGLAPLEGAFHPHGTIKDSYIVAFKDDVHPALVQNHFNFLKFSHQEDPVVGEFGSGLKHVYDAASFKGYSGTFSQQVVDRIRSSPEVDFVEKDQIVRTQNITTQNGAPWGLARISHREKLKFGTFSKYLYDEVDGEGVDVYVVDTGINVDHVEFEGRAFWGATIPANDQDIDGNGHGTHCAGTIASKAYGVSKKAHVYAVKVLGTNGSGSMSDVIKGVSWAGEAAKAKSKAAAAEFAATGKSSYKGSVGSMSLGGGKSPGLDRVVDAVVAGGLPFAVAAGNDNKDACDYSPAASKAAVTVGASALGDERAYFSNHGKCVDIFGPGLNIKSTYKGSKDAVAILSGTSMATPHVAGLMAYLLSTYSSKNFDALMGQGMIPASLKAATPLSVYYMVYQSIPTWLTGYLPAPQFIASLDASAAGPDILSAEQLKKLLLALGTPDVLTDLPNKETPNLLIFNNVTTA